jgi:hypothetical protein
VTKHWKRGARSLRTTNYAQEQHIKWLHDVLKKLPCLKGEKRCNINLVQKPRGVDSWMDLKEAEATDEVYFVNVLQEGETGFR